MRCLGFGCLGFGCLGFGCLFFFAVGCRASHVGIEVLHVAGSEEVGKRQEVDVALHFVGIACREQTAVQEEEVVGSVCGIEL